ncbi:MAG: hypothetical protein ABI593_08365 [Betaproteobacteria bacterium]
MSEPPAVPVPSALTCATFSPFLGESFVAARDGQTVDLLLIEATPVQLKAMDGRALGKSGYVRRDPFVLLFRGPSAPQLRQGLYEFNHPTIGEFQMSIVPVGPGETGLLYEAVFN